MNYPDVFRRRSHSILFPYQVIRVNELFLGVYFSFTGRYLEYALDENVFYGNTCRSGRIGAHRRCKLSDRVFKIILPISTPILATIALFIGVGQWNSWFDAFIFITDQELKPMQTVLLSIISEARYAERLAQRLLQVPLLQMQAN